MRARETHREIEENVKRIENTSTAQKKMVYINRYINQQLLLYFIAFISFVIDVSFAKSQERIKKKNRWCIRRLIFYIAAANLAHATEQKLVAGAILHEQIAKLFDYTHFVERKGREKNRKQNAPRRKPVVPGCCTYTKKMLMLKTSREKM